MRNYMLGVYIFSLHFFGQLCYSQSESVESLKDSLVKQKDSEVRLQLLNQLSESYIYLNLDSALAYAKRAESLALDLDDEYQYLYAIQRVGVYYYYHQELDKAARIFKRGYRRAVQAGLVERQASYLGSLGLLMYAKTQIDSAFYFLEQAFELDRQLQDTLKMLVRLNNIGSLYSIEEQPAKAIVAFYKGLLLAKASGDQKRMAYIAGNMATIYKRYDSEEEALYYTKLALENMDQNDLGKQLLLVNIGEFYLGLDSLHQAEKYFKQAVLDSAKGKDCQVAAAYIGLADLGIRKRQMQQVGKYLIRASKYIELCQDSFHIFNLAIIQSRYARLNREYKEARTSLNKAERFRSRYMNTYLTFEEEKSLLEESLGNYSEALRYTRILNEERKKEYKARYNLEVARAELRQNFEVEKSKILEEQSERRHSLEENLSAFEDLRVIWSIASGFFIITIIVLAVSAYRRKKTAFHFRRLNTIINQQKENLQQKSEQLAISNEKIKELSEFRERLAAMAVHDMKGPLSSIIGLAEGDMSDHKQKLIRKAGQQMLNFLMDLLDIYKFEKASIALQLHMHSIYELVQEAKNSIYYIAEDKGLSCEIDIPKDLQAPLDEGIVVRVLTNLLSNAVKYSHSNAVVKVKAAVKESETGQQLLLTISDQGLGLSKEQLDHMFKPIDFRKDVYISKSTSTGIGLDFCKLAIQAHRGRIWAESKEGVGTTLFLEFPMVQDNHSEPYSPKKESLKESQVKDLEAFKELINDLKNYRIHQAGNILKALHHLENAGVDPQWIAKLKATVYSANEAHYSEMIDKALNDGV